MTCESSFGGAVEWAAAVAPKAWRLRLDGR